MNYTAGPMGYATNATFTSDTWLLTRKAVTGVNQRRATSDRGNDIRLRCGKCKLFCKNRSSFRTHMQEHDRYNCRVCGKKMASQEALLRHTRLNHPFQLSSPLPPLVIGESRAMGVPSISLGASPWSYDSYDYWNGCTPLNDSSRMVRYMNPLFQLPPSLPPSHYTSLTPGPFSLLSMALSLPSDDENKNESEKVAPSPVLPPPPPPSPVLTRTYHPRPVRCPSDQLECPGCPQADFNNHDALQDHFKRAHRVLYSIIEEMDEGVETRVVHPMETREPKNVWSVWGM